MPISNLIIGLLRWKRQVPNGHTVTEVKTLQQAILHYVARQSGWLQNAPTPLEALA